jgi:two-component system phosphate regulon sensor histidine kinase PhoR
MGSSSLLRLLLIAVVSLLVGAWAVQTGSLPALVALTLVAGGVAIGACFFVLRPLERRVESLQLKSGALAESHLGMVGDLRRERDLLGSILDAMQEGLLLLDEKDEIVLVNPSLRSALLLPAEVVGMSLLAALNRAELAELVARARKGETALSREIVVGELKPRRFEVRVSATRTPIGGLLLAFFDVSEIRRLESLRRDFVANVSHELRTPVASISSAAETLLVGALSDPSAAQMFVEIIERNSARMRQLVEDLLDLSRIESKEYKLERDELALSPIVEHSLSLLRDKAKQARVRIDLEIPADLPRVRADRRALDQIMVNLVENAIKYCPPGSRVVVRARTEDEHVQVSVEDSGPGVPEADLPRLFERFYRVDAGRSREKGGTGLGLSIVKHLVEAMGGDVGAESRVGLGSTFWFTVPRA